MIRNATMEDLPALTQMFLQTIHTVNSKDYSLEQIKAWSTGVENKQRWESRVKDQYLILDEENQELRGYASITRGGYIDLMYVSRDHQKKGVARTLYDNLEKYAVENEISELESDVSITARPFFEHMGFKVVKEQRVSIRDSVLTNFKMTKSLRYGSEI